MKRYAQRATDLDRADANKAISAIEQRMEQGATGGKSGETADSAGPKARTWRDASGLFEVQATLVSSEDGKVTLKRKDGRTIAVPVEKLSPADQAYIAEQTKKR